VLAKELAYYRSHFREAIQKDGVICLECGSIFKYLPGHLCKHNLSSHEYRAKWGYNRTTPLERLSTRRKKRRNAIAMKLWTRPSRDAHQKATKARRGHGLPYRPERRLVTTEAARARVAIGFRRLEQRHFTGPRDGLELSKEDRQVLSLRNRGLWPSEMASLLGIRVQSVNYRLERLKKAGFTFAPPTGPRPIPHRKVTDDELLALARSGLSIPEIAARVGIVVANVHRRIKRLTEPV
jgi:ROS/MUCR transcriptional regulator protein/Winged helix-turn-helix DNA-binding